MQCRVIHINTTSAIIKARICVICRNVGIYSNKEQYFELEAILIFSISTIYIIETRLKKKKTCIYVNVNVNCVYG